MEEEIDIYAFTDVVYNERDLEKVSLENYKYIHF